MGDILDLFPSVIHPEPNTGCWLCVSHNNQYGYARYRVGHRLLAVHRLSYELSIGPIAENLEIDHLCHVTCCVNPTHLEAVDHDENMRRQRERNKRNPLCINGHLKELVGVYHAPNGNHACMECRRIWRRVYRMRRSAA